MATTFPSALDTFTTIPSGATQDVLYGGRTHRDSHNDLGLAILAVETKVGTGGGTNAPFLKSLLNGSGVGTAGWVSAPTVAGSFTTEGGLNVGTTGAGTGQIKASAGLLPGADSFAAGKIYTDAASGIVIGGKAGSTSDLLLANSAGGSVMSIPTGATSVTFTGAVDIGSGPFAAGRIGKTAGSGLLIAGAVGSTSDLLITNRAGASVFAVDPSAATVQHYGTFYPNVDNTFDLGTGTRHYRDVYCTRNAFNGSVRDLKRDIAALDPKDALAAILATEIVTFRYRPTDEDDANAERRQVGFLADGVTDDLLSPDHRTASPSTTAAIALAAIQALADGLDALRRQIGVKGA